jgi:trehalose 2-sulfotransferase
VICCVQRTGSWLLAHTLADTGYAGRPADYFDETERDNRTRELGLPAGDLAAYARAVREAATTPNGVLGVKLMWNDFDRLRSATRVPPGADAGQQFLREAFPRPQLVWLRRADKVRQGVSWWRAAQTGQWALGADEPAGRPEPDVEQIIALARYAQRCEDGWRQWFASAGTGPCEVVYEDLARDRLAVTNRVLQFLRLPPVDGSALPPVRYRPQADSLTEHCVTVVRAALGPGELRP